ncbi:MAG: GC-type dockerin domain-anchored protein [Phycisphaerales bacterium]
MCDLIAYRSVLNENGSSTFSSLGMLAGDTQSVARGTNGDGSTIVGHSGVRAFRWHAGEGMVALEGPAGSTLSAAWAVNTDGTVVVGHATTPSGDRAVRWTVAAESLGTPPVTESSRAFGVSGDGSIVVGTAAAGSGPIAIMWTAATGMVDLNTYLPTLGLNLENWRLTAARRVSRDGTCIVGEGLHNGVDEGWIAHISLACNLADIASIGGAGTPDGHLTVDDVVEFLSEFFAAQPPADVAIVGGARGRDGQYTADDVILFLSRFFLDCD